MTPPDIKDEEDAAAHMERDMWVVAIDRLIQDQREAEGQPLLAEPLLAALFFHCADVVMTAKINPEEALNLFTSVLTQVAAAHAATPKSFFVSPTTPRTH